MSAAPRVDVTIACAAWRDLLPDAAGCARTAAAAAWRTAARDSGPDACPGTRPGVRSEAASEISILLTDDATIRALNLRHRTQDKPTNVLSFPLDAGVPPVAEPRLIGDVVLACETIAAEARAQGKTVADHFRHLVVHGVLHLLGYDHVTDGEAAAMERLEVAALQSLDVADPYRHAGRAAGQPSPRQAAP